MGKIHSGHRSARPSVEEVVLLRDRIKAVRRVFDTMIIPQKWGPNVKLAGYALLDRAYQRGKGRFPMSGFEVTQETGLALNTAKKDLQIIATTMPFFLKRSTVRTKGPSGIASEWKLNLDIEDFKQRAIAAGFTFDDSSDGIAEPSPAWATSGSSGCGESPGGDPENTEVDRDTLAEIRRRILQFLCLERRDVWAFKGGLGRPACRAMRCLVTGMVVSPIRRRWDAMAKAMGVLPSTARRATMRLLEHGIAVRDPDGTIRISDLSKLAELIDKIEQSLPSHGRMKRMKKQYAAQREKLRAYWKQRRSREEDYFWSYREHMTPVAKFQWEKWLGYRGWDDRQAAEAA